jgi:hypothetical protein
MNRFQKFAARIFRIKNVKVVRKIYSVTDREFTAEETRAVQDFLNTPAGRQLCSYLVAQKYAVAERAAGQFARGDFWQGYACGYKNAVDNFLTLRPPCENGISSSSDEVGLEELAQKIDQ